MHGIPCGFIVRQACVEIALRRLQLPSVQHQRSQSDLGARDGFNLTDLLCDIQGLPHPRGSGLPIRLIVRHLTGHIQTCHPDRSGLLRALVCQQSVQ